MSAVVTTGQFRFGLFEFDVERLELRRQGSVVHLQSQPSRVLAVLIQNSDRAVSREELRGAIWGQETFVDFERGLNFCISQIRFALGDDSTRPIFIRTFPKQGYQFIAPVERFPREPAAVENRKATPTGGTVKQRAAMAALVVVLLTVGSLAAEHWLRSRPGSKQPPVVAVVRFDNETDDANLTRFSDGLTDNVVERLTSLSDGRYGVIGNGRILRLPREQRDLKAIGDSLHAKYVVLGQVQSDGSQTRILAHLIRMPDQTHLWVVRADRTLTDPLGVESEVAQRIADQFSQRVAADASGNPLPPATSR